MQSLHLDRNWLHQKYIIEQLSTYEIGQIVGRNPKNVYQKLKDFGIPTRSRNQNNQRPKDRDRRRFLMTTANTFKGKTHSPETRKRLSEKASVPRPDLRGSGNGMSGRVGAANPNWKGGGTPDRQILYASAEWKEIVRSVYKRDNYRCQRCQSTHTTKNKLHAHHIKGFTAFPDLRTEPSNLVTLCNHCHIWVHSRQNTDRLFIG